METAAGCTPVQAESKAAATMDAASGYYDVLRSAGHPAKTPHLEASSSTTTTTVQPQNKTTTIAATGVEPPPPPPTTVSPPAAQPCGQGAPMFAARLSEVPGFKEGKLIQEKLKLVPKIEYCERVVEVPKVVTREKVVEVPNVEYRGVFDDNVVEVPHVREKTVIKTVRVPQYVAVDPPPQKVYVDVVRYIPVPVEAVTTYEYRLAQLRPHTTKVKYPMYVPRFIEVPVPEEKFLLDVADDANNDPSAGMSQQQQQNVATAHELASKVSMLTRAPQAVGLRDIETLATDIRSFTNKNFTCLTTDIPEAQEQARRRILKEKWQTGQLPIVISQQEKTSMVA